MIPRQAVQAADQLPVILSEAKDLFVCPRTRSFEKPFAVKITYGSMSLGSRLGPSLRSGWR